MGSIRPKKPYVEPPDFGDVKFGDRLVNLTDGIVEVVGLDKDGMLRVKILYTFRRSPLSGMENTYYITHPPTDKRYWKWKRIKDQITEFLDLAEAAQKCGDSQSMEIYVEQAEELEKWAKRKVKRLRVLVCGGRDFRDASFVFNRLSEYEDQYGEFACIIHGGAFGADTLANEFAQYRQISCTVYRISPGQWHTQGKSAGPRRNRRMLEEGKPDVVIAFPGGRGTADMIRQAHAHGVPVIDVERDPWPDLPMLR